LSTQGLPDGRQQFSGDGTSYGFNLGLHSRLGKNLALGVSYRSGFDVDLKGDVKFNLPSAALEPVLPNSSGETTVRLPDQLHVALAYSGFERWVVETGVRWENWSTYDELRFKTAQPINGSNVSTRATDWHDTLTLTVGGRYRVNDRVRLLAGFVRGEDPIPDKTFEPSVTDSPHYALTAGLEYAMGRHQLAFSYAWQKWFDRNKANEVGAQFSGGAVSDARANGEYSSHSHFLAASFTYVF
ncbi:MAG: outer membrane protein transport protein, partial [Burkholderiales bacterium]